MGSGNRKGDTLNVLSVVQVGRLARVSYEGGYIYIQINKLSQALKARII